MRPATKEEEAKQGIGPGARAILDYDTLFDGNPWVLEASDYAPRTIQQVRNAIYEKAKRDGLKASITHLGNGTIMVLATVRP